MQVVQEWPGSSTANAACNARRLWTGASNLVVLSAMPTTLTSQRAVLVERAAAFPRPHVAMPLDIALSLVNRGDDEDNDPDPQPQLRLLPIYSSEQQQRQDQCINGALALSADFVQVRACAVLCLMCGCSALTLAAAGICFQLPLILMQEHFHSPDAALLSQNAIHNA